MMIVIMMMIMMMMMMMMEVNKILECIFFYKKERPE